MIPEKEQNPLLYRQALALRRACEVFYPGLDVNFCSQYGPGAEEEYIDYLSVECMLCELCFMGFTREELQQNIRDNKIDRTASPMAMTPCSRCKGGTLFISFANQEVEGFAELYQLGLLEDL